MKEQVRDFRNSNFKHKMKRLQIPQKLSYEIFYVNEKLLRTRSCRLKFIKNFTYWKTQRKHVNQTSGI